MIESIAATMDPVNLEIAIPAMMIGALFGLLAASIAALLFTSSGSRQTARSRS